MRWAQVLFLGLLLAATFQKAEDTKIGSLKIDDDIYSFFQDVLSYYKSSGIAMVGNQDPVHKYDNYPKIKNVIASPTFVASNFAVKDNSVSANTQTKTKNTSSKKVAVAILASVACTALLVAIIFAVLARRPVKKEKKDDDYFTM